MPAATAPRLTVAFTLAPASREAEAVTDNAPFTGHWMVVLNRLLEPEKVIGAVVDESVWLNVFAFSRAGNSACTEHGHEHEKQSGSARVSRRAP